ncbi:hypothetical protein Q3A66_08665 [Hymenobacter sp. BT770]|uniref:hypothetical protein n=1 Tax=Hymenobacter sp. BT770 TaxID=2886942 RepID=UPI001D111899|nr:hypothetical protein [Hymenobacter sp. BT770]MCC3152948.1 hypothetical protein [Hymenobacter sp. BT770]MDO3415138.1 hypothetical protein [Hymenobacter sp. BT770]
MPPEDIDDLFRDRLDGHTTPPGDALWARLQAQTPPEPAADANAERLDLLFQKGLNTHRTPPGRELWERLEDEHLRPKKRRAAAWWPMAVAAALALLLVAGGAGLWLGFPLRPAQTGSVASQQQASSDQPALNQPNNTDATKATPGVPATEQEVVAAAEPNHTPESTLLTPAEKNITSQATRPEALASTAPKARMSAPGQSPRHLMETSRQPDAATARLPLVARATARAASHPTPPRPTAADEQRPTNEQERVLALNPKPAPAAEIVPASSIPNHAVATAPELITVEVRNGGEPAVTPSKLTAVAMATEAPSERRRLGGRLLQQAGNLVRGERVSLAEVTGLPENVTVRATVAGHSLTKSIQL